MKVILREDTSGVSEVIGTILILAMTVVLFSVIIVWVTNIPTPAAQSRLEIRSEMIPIYSGGVEVGVNITLTHLGGDVLAPVPTIIYVTSQRGANPPQTDIVTLHLYNGLLATPSGLLDGSNSVWDIGERWAYKNYLLRSSDQISIAIVDVLKGVVVWTGPMNAPAGTRPPVFLEKWTDGIPTTPIIDPVQTNLGFSFYVTVVDPDGDLDPNSVYANITAAFGVVPGCSAWLKMYDDGPAGGHGDAAAGDNVFTLSGATCMIFGMPPLVWDGSIILLKASDLKGHQTATRFILHVVPQTTGGSSTTIPSQLWQYIGYVQIRTGEVWITNLSKPYSTSDKFLPYRVAKNWLGAGVLFQFRMANHGNTTIFIDGYTQAFFQNTQSSSGVALYVVAPCNPNIPANGGGVQAYPGIPSTTDFQYAHSGLPAGCSAGVPPGVFDINTFDQEKGGTPYVTMIYAKTPFSTGTPFNWPNSATYYISILVSGMAGPANYTYAQLTGSGPNPLGCAGLGAGYNPYNHLADPIVGCRSTWYAQVIPFVGMTVI